MHNVSNSVDSSVVSVEQAVSSSQILEVEYMCGSSSAYPYDKFYQRNNADGDIQTQQIKSNYERVSEGSMEIEEKISSNDQMNLYHHSDNEDVAATNKSKSDGDALDNDAETHQSLQDSSEENTTSVSGRESRSDGDGQSDSDDITNESKSDGDALNNDAATYQSLQDISETSTQSLSEDESRSDSENQSEMNEATNKSMSGRESRSDADNQSDSDDITNKSRSGDDALDNDDEMHQSLPFDGNQLDDNKKAKKSDSEDKYNQVPNTCLNEPSISSPQINTLSLN